MLRQKTVSCSLSTNSCSISFLILRVKALAWQSWKTWKVKECTFQSPCSFFIFPLKRRTDSSLFGSTLESLPRTSFLSRMLILSTKLVWYTVVPEVILQFWERLFPHLLLCMHSALTLLGLNIPLLISVTSKSTEKFAEHKDLRVYPLLHTHIILTIDTQGGSLDIGY